MNKHVEARTTSNAAADATLASVAKNPDGESWQVVVPHLFGTEPQVAVTGEYVFSGELREKMVAAIVRGEKTATASLLEEYQRGEEPLPKMGDMEVVIDSYAKPVCLTRVTDVYCEPFGNVSDEHAIAEGEGFNDAEAWRVAHKEFWTSLEFVAGMGEPEVMLDDATVVVLVSMEVIAKL
ncbi:ASCH domain-containing protein [Corynebacteriaceae bacterium 6-324]